jgi:hypothetical protein
MNEVVLGVSGTEQIFLDSSVGTFCANAPPDGGFQTYYRLFGV